MIISAKELYSLTDAGQSGAVKQDSNPITSFSSPDPTGMRVPILLHCMFSNASLGLRPRLPQCVSLAVQPQGRPAKTHYMVCTCAHHIIKGGCI